MKKTVTTILMLSVVTLAYSQKKEKRKTKIKEETETAVAAPVAVPSDGFSKTPTGIDYKIIVDAPGDAHPKVGDFVEVTISTKINDSVLFDTHTMNNGQPVQFQVQQPGFKGDLVEGLMMMTPGDSAIFKLSVDTLLKSGQPEASWMKKGQNQKLIYNIKLVSVKTADQIQKDAQDKMAAQKDIDEKILLEYFAKKNIKATKTASGLYYKIDKQGTGIVAKAGDTVVVNYTGKTMDGKAFDSNVDSTFMHVEPFKFTVGMRQVIAGWDEGFQIFKKGSKGTLYIPSYLAYGDRSPDPNRIPNNGILLFDVELKDVKPAKK
jgi:FKBP-type peptidyl-prolyl cis-trans isomerase FkpA